MNSKYLTFVSGENKLEGVLYIPNENRDLITIILHPHPEFGGSMNNNVVDGVCDTYYRHGYATFKFNVSGVGRSTGVFKGFPRAHKDVEASIHFLKEELKFKEIGFIGYSWGSYAGLKALYKNNSISYLCGIAMPLKLWDYSFLTDSESQQPKCFILGEYDDFSDKRSFLELYNKIPKIKKDYKILPTDHFYAGYETEAAKFIIEFITNKVQNLDEK